MSIQLRASFKKEYLAFFRTKRALIISAVLIGLAIFMPLMIWGLGVLMNAMSPIYEELGMDVSIMTEMLGSSVSMGVMTGVSEMTATGLIVLLILINSFAGGEQKKRSIIIPSSSGLRGFAYISPKFVIYPLTAFVLAIIGAFASWGISSVIYEVNDVSSGGVLLGGILAGVSLMFYVCCHITLGTSTGQAGVSAAVCIVASLILSNVFSLTSSDYMYNPFALSVLAASVVQEGALAAVSPRDVIMTILITLVLMVIVYFIALFVQNAKKIDNSGDEIRI